MPEAEPILATDIGEMVHTPPPDPLVSKVVPPIHNWVEPPMGDGAEFTVTLFAAVHPVGSVYVIVAIPGATAVTRPDDEPTVATPVPLLVHAPPGSVASIAPEVPVHNPVTPDTTGTGLILTLRLTVQLPIA